MTNENSPGHILRQLKDLLERDLSEIKDCVNEHGKHLHRIDIELERRRGGTNWERTIIAACTIAAALAAVLRIWG